MPRRIREVESVAPQPALTISPEKVCFVVVKAREFDAKEAPTDPDSGSNPSDDKGIDVLEDSADDPVADELTGFIDALSQDEQTDLVALAWLGRDGGGPEDWRDTRREAARAHNRRTSTYLIGMPLVADFIEEGLSTLGLSCEEFELGRL